MGHTDVAGDIKQLAPLVDLMTLNLRQTSASGNLLSLAPLHFVLSKLNLAATNVDGNVGQLFPHLQLEHLDLSITNVGGMIEGLRPLVKLQTLRLANTKVKTARLQGPGGGVFDHGWCCHFDAPLVKSLYFSHDSSDPHTR